MAKSVFMRVRVAALILTGVGIVLGAVPAQAESPGDSLSANLKVLATSPRNFDALIAAGRASLALGDSQAAAGFFGRAEEVWPASALPQAGMGAALALDGDGAGALQYFARAAQRGATQSMIGADRGLAYDLTGQHALAQADYRAALSGRDADEARRRLAMSLAISGNKAEALTTIGPLMARGDAAGARCRAFILALSGDTAGARAAIDAAMPGSSRHMEYFFQRLPTLRSDQKAAAVNLGLFPGSGTQSAMASNENRIDSIQQWLSQTAQPQPQPSIAAPQQGVPTRLASVSAPARQIVHAVPAASAPSRVWLQLASGSNPSALPQEFNRLKSRNSDLFDGISGYVAQDGGRSRLLIGPFRDKGDASIFAEDLQAARITAFPWTNSPGQNVSKLPGQ